jgi:hypothetical protein
VIPPPVCIEYRELRLTPEATGGGAAAHTLVAVVVHRRISATTRRKDGERRNMINS